MTRIATAHLALSLALSLAACEVRDSEEPAAAPEAVEPEPSSPEVAEAPQAPSPAIPSNEVPSPPGPGVGDTPSGQLAPPRNMQKLGEMLGRAAQAADEASAEGGSHCERAYAGAVAMARALHEQMGSGNPEASLPARGDFVSACSDLPEEVQRCMVVSYSIQNQAECRRVRQENQELMNRVREIMGQARAGAPAAQGGQEAN